MALISQVLKSDTGLLSTKLRISPPAPHETVLRRSEAVKVGVHNAAGSGTKQSQDGGALRSATVNKEGRDVEHNVRTSTTVTTPFSGTLRTASMLLLAGYALYSFMGRSYTDADGVQRNIFRWMDVAIACTIAFWLLNAIAGL